jgi:hypothetical protein
MADRLFEGANRRRAYLALAALAALLAALVFAGRCQRTAQPQQLTGNTMGTSYSVTYRGDVHPARLKAALAQKLAHFEQVLSNWREDSWVRRFNRHRTPIRCPCRRSPGRCCNGRDVWPTKQAAPSIQPLGV